jgi:hypothetical protein
MRPRVSQVAGAALRLLVRAALRLLVRAALRLLVHAALRLLVRDALRLRVQVPIQTITYSFTLPAGSFVRSAARPANGSVVVVETELPVTGSVVVTVDQSLRS